MPEERDISEASVEESDEEYSEGSEDDKKKKKKAPAAKGAKKGGSTARGRGRPLAAASKGKAQASPGRSL